MPDTLARSPRNPRLARLVDVVVSAVTLVLLAPVLMLIAITILIGSGRPVLFRQERLGRHGVPFALHKFRSLTNVKGPPIAPSNDVRATAVGRVLRRWHLDELPQLLDVLRGDMALVGPRPEVPANLVAIDSDELALLQTVRPGITGPTQLAFLAEDDVLAECEQATTTYRQVLVPAKVRHDLCWLERRTLRGDLAILLRTPLALASHRSRARSRRRVLELIASHAAPSTR